MAGSGKANYLLRMLSDFGDDPRAVGQRLTAVRTFYGLSKLEFAERAGIRAPTYNPFEKGKDLITMNVARKIRKTYKADLEFIYFGDTSRLPHDLGKFVDAFPVSPIS